MISAQYATNTLALIMTDMVIGPVAEYPDFAGNSLTGPGLGARRNAESCHIINVCTPQWFGWNRVPFKKRYKK